MNCCRLEIHLKPRAKSDRIMMRDGGGIDIAVTSPPVDEKANAHLLALLADRLGIAKSGLSIIRGGRCRNKVVAVEGMATEEAMRKLCGR